MSKLKSKYFDFINSEDYSQYNLSGSSQDVLERAKTASESFSYLQVYQGSQEVRKRLIGRFKRSKNTA